MLSWLRGLGRVDAYWLLRSLEGEDFTGRAATENPVFDIPDELWANG